MAALLYNASLCNTASGSASLSTLSSHCSLPLEGGAVPQHDACWKTDSVTVKDSKAVYTDRHSMHTSIKLGKKKKINKIALYVLHNTYRHKAWPECISNTIMVIRDS